MTVEQFRNHDTYPILWAQELENNHLLRVVLSVMDDAHPARFAIQEDNAADVSPTRAAIELGLTRGYSKYGDTLKLLARPKRRPVDIGETLYAPEQQEEPQP
jgi:hypothetical protein